MPKQKQTTKRCQKHHSDVIIVIPSWILSIQIYDSLQDWSTRQEGFNASCYEAASWEMWDAAFLEFIPY